MLESEYRFKYIVARYVCWTVIVLAWLLAGLGATAALADAMSRSKQGPSPIAPFTPVTLLLSAAVVHALMSAVLAILDLARNAFDALDLSRRHALSLEAIAKHTKPATVALEKTYPITRDGRPVGSLRVDTGAPG